MVSEPLTVILFDSFEPHPVAIKTNNKVTILNFHLI
jgi:hypothetical protein